MENELKTTRYIIQDKHFVLDEKFVITDESGIVHYTVDATLFTPEEKLVLYDGAGNELIQIRHEHLHIHPTYNIYSARAEQKDVQLASIRRTGAPWNHKLEINTNDGKYLIENKNGPFSHEFVLTKDDKIVAIVSKDTSLSTSVYYVDVASDREEYRAFLVALVVVLSSVQRFPGRLVSTNCERIVKF